MNFCFMFIRLLLTRSNWDQDIIFELSIVCSYLSKVVNAIKQKRDKSRDMGFPTMWYVRPAEAQTSLRIRAD